MLSKLKEGHWPIFILTSFSSIANLFLPIILTRLLSPEDIGTYKIFFLYLTLIPFLFLTGGPLHSVYYWIGKKENRQTYINSAYQLTIFLSLFIAIIGVPFYSYFAELIGLNANNTLVLIFVAVLWVPSSFYKEYKLAQGHTVYGSIFGTLMELIKVVLFISLAYQGYQIAFLFKAYLFFLIFKAILTLVLGLKEQLNPITIDLQKMKEVWNYCTPIALAGLLSFFVDKMDQIVLTKFLAKDDFAFYTMGCLIIPPLLLLEMSVNKVLIPKTSEYWEDNKDLCLEFFRKAVSDSALLLIPASVGLYIFAKPIVELLYTSKFLDSVKYLEVFAFSYLILIIPYDAVPRATGNTKWIFKMSVLVSPLSLLGILLASTYYGAYEVLLVSIGFKLLYRVLALSYTCKIMNWSVFATLPLKKVSIFSFVSIILGIVSLMTQNYFPNDLYWFFAMGIIFFIMYFVALIIPYKKGYFNV
tara:strand:- start:48107 stop:49522 length:1416 start_codon:yes stop_codon:yes gene_type:complete